jgi:DNA-binding NtrC family response regulator
VETCSAGAEAVSRLKESAFDVLVLDLEMRPLSGWDVLRAIEEHSISVQTIVASSFVDVPVTVALMRKGVADVMAKPFPAPALVERVRGMRAEPTERPKTDRADDELLLGDSRPMRVVREQIAKVAAFPDVSVMILGETGTGKELVAESIHRRTNATERLVPVNCSAVPESLFESELFGHEAGAFTGARGRRAGLFEAAGRGTLFLDEVGDLPASLQPKLLRALESRTFRRVGASTDESFHARVVSATNRCNVGSGAGDIRPELYFRLTGFTILVPPLRERAEDIEALARHFAEAFGARHGRGGAISSAALAALSGHAWPGNVRELKSVVEHAAVLASGAGIEPAHVKIAMSERAAIAAGASGAMETAAPRGTELRDVEKDVVLGAYEASESLAEAARRLGIARSTLREKLRRYGVR